MKIIKNILAVSVLCACTLNVAAMELCGGCCGATWVSQYDSVANCYKCYLAPYVTQAKARPIYGRVAATIVEYDTVIVSFFPETDVFRIDIDTITGIGTIDQATDSLKIDCAQWETGLYSIRGYVNVTTEMIPQFDSCFPLEHYLATNMFRHVKRESSTKLADVYAPQPLELEANVVQNRLKIIWGDAFEPSQCLIFNVLGQLQGLIDVQSPYDAVDVSRFPDGFYILSVQNRHETRSAWFKIRR